MVWLQYITKKPICQPDLVDNLAFCLCTVFPLLVHILSPVTDNFSSWISRRGGMAVEIFSWPSLHERMCRTWGSNSEPLAYQADTLPIELPRPARPVWVLPGRKPRRQVFSWCGSNWWVQRKSWSECADAHVICWLCRALAYLSHVTRKYVFGGLRPGKTQTSLLSYRG